MSNVVLQPGDAVGVVAPGYAVKRAELKAGLAQLKAMGLEPLLGRHVRDTDGYLAGSDDARVGDLNAMLKQRRLKALWFARGGYGVGRILDRVRWDLLKKRAPLLIGYSDLTALFNPALDRTGCVCLYGPVVQELGNPASFHGGSLAAALSGEPAELTFGRRQVLVPGQASGKLYGGNLSVLAHLWGTEFAPNLRKRILFLEDIGESLYRVDRSLTQLRLAGAFRGLAGVLFGGFDMVPRTHAPRDRRVLDVIRENFCDQGIPVVRKLPVGHVPNKRTLPLGAQTTIDTDARRISFRYRRSR